MSADAIASIWGDSPLSAPQKVVALAIAEVVNDAHDHMFWMHPGKLAKKVDMSPGRVRHRLAELVDLGFLTVIEQGGGRGKTTTYQWNLEPRSSCAESAEETAQPRTETAQEPTETAQRVREDTSYIENKEQKRTEGSPTTLADEDFSTFWCAYPRAKNRAAARRAWEKALKVASATEILSGLQTWLEDFRAMDIEFIPYPATWLAQEAWADVTDEAVRQRQSEVRDAYWSTYTTQEEGW